MLEKETSRTVHEASPEQTRVSETLHTPAQRGLLAVHHIYAGKLKFRLHICHEPGMGSESHDLGHAGSPGGQYRAWPVVDVQ